MSKPENNQPDGEAAPGPRLLPAGPGCSSFFRLSIPNVHVPFSASPTHQVPPKLQAVGQVLFPRLSLQLIGCSSLSLTPIPPPSLLQPSSGHRNESASLPLARLRRSPVAAFDRAPPRPRFEISREQIEDMEVLLRPSQRAVSA